MVRTYKPKNPYDIGSKLTKRQTEYLFIVYFYASMSIDFISRNSEISPKTIRAKMALINDLVHSDRNLMSELMDYLSPEMNNFQKFIRDKDLSRGAPVWCDLQQCLFECPAKNDVNMPFEDFLKSPAMAHLQEVTLTCGQVTEMRIHCSACRIMELRIGVTGLAFFYLARRLKAGGHTYKEALYENFFRTVFELVIQNKILTEMTEEGLKSRGRGDPEVGRRFNETACELARIIAKRVRQTPFGSEIR